MFTKRRDNLSRRAMTLLEMVLAMSITAVIFAALLPQFRVVLNSWATREGGAESLQNARVLIDHFNRNLSKAAKVTAVSDSTTTSGYIEYEDAAGDTFRYDVGGGNYVQFGEVNDVYDLAGPVSKLQFTCYDACDLDTALSPITDANLIHFVEAEATLTNPTAMGQDKTFTTSVFLRAGWNPGSDWAYRRKLTFDNSGQSEALVNFPVWSSSAHRILIIRKRNQMVQICCSKMRTIPPS